VVRLCGSGFLRFRVATKGCERDLGRVQERAALLGRNGADEDAAGRAGNEVADAVVAGELGHGVAVSLGRFLGCVELVESAWRGVFHEGIERALPGGTATFERGPGGFGLGADGKRRGWGGGDEAEFCFGCIGH